MEETTLLPDSIKIVLAERIHSLIPHAKNKNDPLFKFARTEIMSLLWRFTADGMKKGYLARDAIKYKCTHIPYTQKAKAVLNSNETKGLRHEHAVPRKFIAEEIIKRNESPVEICSFIDQYCKAVLVTKEEDSRLKPKSSMPDSWDWNDDIYQRYNDANIKITFP